jgi:DNA modification methylase
VTELNKIYNVDGLTGLSNLENGSVDCCVTSPPYFALRDYGVSKTSWPEVKYKLFRFDIIIPSQECCLGLENSPEAFIGHMVFMFREVKRVLKDHGTCWINIGDSYNGSGKGGNADFMRNNESNKANPTKIKSLKNKDLIGIPWMLAVALRSDGWYLRQDIIWSKPNPMPESVTDRCTKSHEYIFLLSKSPKYYFDNQAIKTALAGSSCESLSQDLENQKGSDRVPGKINGTMKAVYQKRNPRKGIDVKGGNQGSEDGIPSQGLHGIGFKNHSGNYRPDGSLIGDGMANKRSVWNVATRPFKEAHFATFPQELITDCIKAGCPIGGTVLDIFGGAGTTGIVSRKLDRNFILMEINPSYVNIANKRMEKELGLFK